MECLSPDLSQFLFYFVAEESYSQAGSTTVIFFFLLILDTILIGILMVFIIVLLINLITKVNGHSILVSDSVGSMEVNFAKLSQKYAKKKLFLL